MEPSQAQKAQDKVGDGNNNNKGERRRKISQEEPLPCPRCESTNTKFCYYNNYSLTQPRHFCKACKRYWTRGGSLRNIPIGGGCRKNKTKSKEHHHAQPHIRQPHIIIQEGGGAKAFPSSLLLPSSRMLGITGASCGNDTMVSSSTAASAMPSRGSSILASSCHALASLPALDSTLFSMGLMSSPPTTSTSISSSSLEPLTNLNADLQWRIHHQRLQSILAANAIDDANKENSSSTTSSAYSISKSPCFPTSPCFPGLFQDRSSSSMFSETLQTIPTTPQDGSSSISSVPNVFHLWNHPLLWSAADYHHQHNNHNASMY